MAPLHAVLLLLVYIASGAISGQAEPSVDPWPSLLATMATARPSAVYEFTDYEVPRDPSVRTKCLGARFCDCTILSGYNRTFWLNTASAVFDGQVYLVILQRTVTLRSIVHYRQNNKTLKGQVFEANSLLFCKAQLLGKFELKREDCKLVEPGPGYKEKHPYPPRGFHFELNGLIDPRLISAGDNSGLFLQAGCRPRHLADNENATTVFREGLCLVKLLDGKPSAQDASRKLLAGSRGKTKQLQESDPLLPGMTIQSKDWPLGKLMSITHASGVGAWEKSWVPFVYKGTTLWSRSLSPHQVVTVHADGVATTLYKVENKGVFLPLKSACGTGPRGNTPAVLLTPEQSGLPRPVYLNILHLTPHRKSFVGSLDRNCHEYLNFWYLMDSEPPFNILEVARPPIPLVASTNPILDNPPLSFGMGYISFPTGLVILEDQVVITYGSGDTQFRVFRTALTDVLNTFTHTWITNPPNSTILSG